MAIYFEAILLKLIYNIPKHEVKLIADIRVYCFSKPIP